MTEAEEQALQNRLDRANEIRAEIRSLKNFIELGKQEGTVNTTVYVRSLGGGGFREVSHLSQKTRDELNSAAISTLKTRLYELEEEYKKC